MQDLTKPGGGETEGLTGEFAVGGPVRRHGPKPCRLHACP